MRTPASRRSSAPKGPSCGTRTRNTDSTRRVNFTDTSVSVYGWPSRGGVIILNDATHVDFTFLDLCTTKPHMKRFPEPTDDAPLGDGKNQGDPGTASGAYETRGLQPAEGGEEDNQNHEDDFCQRLLLLGAKWWDSEKRYQSINHFAADIQKYVEDVEEGRVAEPTLRERRWIKVGWRSATASAGATFGGFWIIDRDNRWMGMGEEDDLIPLDAAKIKLAKTMDERCEILKDMGACFYASMEAYQSKNTFLRAWEWKWEGEIRYLIRVEW